MKRCLLISLLVVLSVSYAMACASDFVTRYYIYYVPEADYDDADARNERLAREWSRLLGVRIIGSDVSNLPYESSDVTRKSNNPIVKACFNGRNQQAMSYLKLLLDCNNELGLSYNEWSYPSKETIRNHNQKIRRYLATARSRFAGKLGRQYRLMAMRCAFDLKDYALCAEIWRSMPKDNSVFYDIARNLYAGVLYRTGHKAEAFAIYSAMGDQQSASWCAAKTGSVDGIRNFYVTDCNSPVLPFLIKQFCNNTQETFDAVADSIDSDYFDMAGFREINADTQRDFMTLALEAAANPKVTDPRMWLNAAALVKYYNCDYGDAAALMARARQASGSKGSELCSRYISMFVDAALTESDSLFRDMAIENLTWLDARRADSHAANMLTRMVFEVVAPRFKKSGFTNDLLASYAIYWRAEDNVGDSWNYNYSDDYYTALFSLPLDSILQWKEFIKPGRSGNWAPLLAKLKPQADYLNDLIGTRYIRLGRWNEAMEYLSSVPLSFLSAQNIAPFAAKRSFEGYAWSAPRETVDEYNFKGTLSRNAKLDFCKYIMELEKTPDSYERDMKLASAYFLISGRGKCWWITDYGCHTYYVERPVSPDIDYLALAGKYAGKAVGRSAGRQKAEALYAGSFISNYDLLSRNWSTDSWELDKNSSGYGAFSSLLSYIRQNYGSSRSSDLPVEITTCDVLKQFTMR